MQPVLNFLQPVALRKSIGGEPVFDLAMSYYLLDIHFTESLHQYVMILFCFPGLDSSTHSFCQKGKEFTLQGWEMIERDYCALKKSSQTSFERVEFYNGWRSCSKMGKIANKDRSFQLHDVFNLDDDRQQAMATKFEIEKFNGNNFSLWKLKMKAILRKDKCLAAIGERPAEVTDDSKWDEMDGNAIANLHLALADGVLSSIEEKKTAREIWDHLARLYEARTLHNKNFLKRKLYALRMTESTSVTEHVNNLNTLFSQLTSLDCKIDPQERAEILLQSLPDSYDQFFAFDFEVILDEKSPGALRISIWMEI
ncbi:hypothetical protein Tco_0599165 [Tanacetum coccineum]